jgi:hypothetical protein
MTKQLLNLIVLITFSVSPLLAQTKITGTVTDANNQPIPGANIVLKGKIAGTITDDDGNFEFYLCVTSNYPGCKQRGLSTSGNY